MVTSHLIKAADLHARLNEPKLRIVDCRFSLADLDRGRRAYAESHLPNAIYVHLEEELSGQIVKGVTGRHPLPEPAVFLERLGAWGIDRGTTVVLYDDANGAHASRMWWMLRCWLGHAAVMVLDGAWKSWVDGGFPTTQTVPQPAPCTYAGSVDSSLVWDAETLWEELSSGRALVVDARELPRFLGEHEPIDTKAGRIPGALSRPYMGNLDEQGFFRAKAALAERFADLKPVEGREVVVYCGSGVTAAHNLLAMHHAGIQGARLYAGSWSDWITQSSRPIASGPV